MWLERDRTLKAENLTIQAITRIPEGQGKGKLTKEITVTSWGAHGELHKKWESCEMEERAKPEQRAESTETFAPGGATNFVCN